MGSRISQRDVHQIVLNVYTLYHTILLVNSDLSSLQIMQFHSQMSLFFYSLPLLHEILKDGSHQVSLFLHIKMLTQVYPNILLEFHDLLGMFLPNSTFHRVLEFVQDMDYHHMPWNQLHLLDHTYGNSFTCCQAKLGQVLRLSLFFHKHRNSSCQLQQKLNYCLSIHILVSKD